MSHFQFTDERKGPASYPGIAVLSFFLLFAVHNSAFAQAPVTYNYTTDPLGILVGCPACNFGGQSVTGSFVYDHETPFTRNPRPGLSMYIGSISDFSGSVGTYSFSDDLGPGLVGNEFVSGNRDILRLSAGLFLNGFAVDDFTLVDVRLLWLEGSLGVPDFLDNQSLPTEPPGYPGFVVLVFEHPSYPGTDFEVSFPNLRVSRAPTNVSMDIMPGETTNSINPMSMGDIPVAILTTDTFDATQIDPLSVTFGVLPVTESHGRGHIEDVDGDGDADLVLHFNNQATDISCFDSEAFLFGQTFEGESIAGSDVITVVGCP